MKKIFFLIAITCLMLSSACKKEVTTLSQDRTATERASSGGGAVPFSNVFTISVVGESGYNPCTNEIMTVTSGSIMIDVHGLYNNNKSTITIHANAQNQKAVGESGRQYVLSGSYNEQTNDFYDGVFTTKLMHFDRWTTAGSENNGIIKDIYYIKVDADGNVTVIRDEVHEFYCQ